MVAFAALFAACGGDGATRKADTTSPTIAVTERAASQADEALAMRVAALESEVATLQRTLRNVQAPSDSGLEARVDSLERKLGSSYSSADLASQVRALSTEVHDLAQCVSELQSGSRMAIHC